MMNLNYYQFLAQRTARHDWGQERRLTMAALGAAGKSGEFADHVKKIYFHEHPLDAEKIKLELGDILWYIAEAASALDITLEEVAHANIDKLARRYPTGFSVERSRERAE